VTNVCQPCTVTCQDDGVTCGGAVQARLSGGGTIVVCPGRYQGNFQLEADVTLIGAGEGADPTTNTIPDANGGGRVVTVGTGANATMIGLRITGGNLNAGNGGGVRNQGTLTLTLCTVHKNKAVDGGGISQAPAASGPLTPNACSITENGATAGGGLDLNGQHSVVLNGCVVAGNEATFNVGGGITISEWPVNVIDGAIVENSSAGDAGGIFAFESTLTFNAGSRVMVNTAANVFGAILNSQGTVNLNGATVSGNSAPQCVGVAGC
jgi:hypothetical protein